MVGDSRISIAGSAASARGKGSLRPIRWNTRTGSPAGSTRTPHPRHGCDGIDAVFLYPASGCFPAGSMTARSRRGLPAYNRWLGRLLQALSRAPLSASRSAAAIGRPRDCGDAFRQEEPRLGAAFCGPIPMTANDQPPDFEPFWAAAETRLLDRLP